MSRLDRLFLVVLVALLLFGCGEKTLEPEEYLASTTPPPYLLKNPLEIIINEKTEGSFTERTLLIEGLSDKGIQEAINHRIAVLCQDVVSGDLPPYRGIQRKVPAGSILTGSNVDASIAYNYNNVASVVIYGNRSFSNSVNVGMMEGLTFDLNTGEEITLKQIFADDVDYIALINDKIGEALDAGNAFSEPTDFFMPWGANLKLVAPFKGISEDQKFYLFQGGLCLIFDDATPEFDIDLYATTLNIGFEELGDALAVTRRFSDREDYEKTSTIYEKSSPPVYEFLPGWDQTPIREEELLTIGDANVYRSMTLHEEIPVAAKQKARDLYQESLELGDWTSVEQYVWTTQVGGYTTVSRNISQYHENHWKNQVENACFDPVGKEIELADLFDSAYNYKKVIVSGLEKALKDRPDLSGIQPADLYEDLQFALNFSDISFTTAPIMGRDSSEAPVYFSISFEEFGCSNMQIFAPVS